MNLKVVTTLTMALTITTTTTTTLMRNNSTINGIYGIYVVFLIYEDAWIINLNVFFMNFDP